MARYINKQIPSSPQCFFKISRTYLYASLNPPFAKASFSILNSIVAAVKDHPSGSNSKDLTSIKVVAFFATTFPSVSISDTERLFGKTLICLGDHVLSLSTEVEAMETLEAGLLFLLGGPSGLINMLLSWSCSCH